MNGVLKDQKLLTAWSLMEEAVVKRNAFTLMQLATVTMANTPRLRAVIVRSFSRKENIIGITADYRSLKISELKNNAHVALNAVDNDRSIQLRIEGVAEIVDDYVTRQKAWRKLSPTSYKLFTASCAPGTKLPYSDINETQQDNLCDINHPARNFCLIHIKIEQIDLLEFKTEPHVRYQYIKIADEWVSYLISP